MYSMIWLRNDLRVLDNVALQAAMQQGEDGCIAIFFITPRQWNLHGWGSPRTCFTMECLRVLKIELESLGIPLLVRRAEVNQEIPLLIQSIASHHRCQSVHVNREPGIDELLRDMAVGQRLKQDNITFDVHDSNTVLPVHEIKTGEGKPYSVFTPFSRRWLAHLMAKGIPAPVIPLSLPTPTTESDPIPKGLVEFPDWEGSHLWQAGTLAARERLDQFLGGPLTTYHISRDTPAIHGTSTLSPWLATGAISPITITRSLLDRYGDEFDSWDSGPKAWLNEIIWREFYRHVMHGFPRVSKNQPMIDWTSEVPWRLDDVGFEAWCEGKTGLDLIDAGMKQLQQTGWMHNRVRMIAAMFLTKNLLIDWRRGEAFFAKHLVDYDFASNNGGWQWAASTGTDAAPYFRIFNSQRQADTWDTKGDYIRRWLGREPDSLKPIVDLKSTRRRAIATFKDTKLRHQTRSHQKHSSQSKSEETIS